MNAREQLGTGRGLDAQKTAKWDTVGVTRKSKSRNGGRHETCVSYNRSCVAGRMVHGIRPIPRNSDAHSRSACSCAGLPPWPFSHRTPAGVSLSS
jgi:hypothetical protein